MRFWVTILVGIGLLGLTVFLLYPSNSLAPTNTPTVTQTTMTPTNPTMTDTTSTAPTTVITESNATETPSENITPPETVTIVETNTPEPTAITNPDTTTAEEKWQFTERFEQTFTIKEVGEPNESTSLNWWVSSGGYFYGRDGVGSTVVGDLPETDERFVAYHRSNPLDTDGGAHPQNIFRLVQRDIWSNTRQEAYFKIIDNNFSDSRNRNASNGLLFFNRYIDEDNLYYTGIRVDGFATIKKKINGKYYTLAYQQLFNAGNEYNKNSEINLLPINEWIGLRSVVATNLDGTVTIELYVDKDRTGSWQLIAKAIDDGVRYGGPVFTSGHSGIRTDFMDVLFDDYSITEL